MERTETVPNTLEAVYKMITSVINIYCFIDFTFYKTNTYYLAK